MDPQDPGYVAYSQTAWGEQPEIDTASAPGAQQPTTAWNPEHERTALWQSVMNLSQQQQHTTHTLEQLLQRFAQLPVLGAPTPAPAAAQAAFSPTSAPSGPAVKFEPPRKFNGKPDQVKLFLDEVDAGLYHQRKAITTDYEKSLWFSGYLADGAPKSWWFGLKAENPGLLHSYPELIEAFKEDRDSRKMGLRVNPRGRQADANSTFEKIEDLVSVISMSCRNIAPLNA